MPTTNTGDRKITSNHNEIVLDDRYEALKAERDALAAQVKLMADTLKNFHPDCFEYQENDFGLGDDVVEVLSKAPQECLRDIQADAGRAGFIAGVNAHSNAKTFGAKFDRDSRADQYAATVRQGGAE